MDNICHTLTGAVLAQAGLKRRTPLATAALLFGANLPDVDAFAYAWDDVTALAFRRGWTHGPLAAVVLPAVLTGALLGYDRLVRRRRRRQALPASGRELFLLSFVAFATHPLLDFLNVYGVRWLMPFSRSWFYGDALFIVDLWLWVLFGSGVLASVLLRRGARPQAERPARAALAIAGVYIAAMFASNLVGRRLVEASGNPATFAARGLMVAPLPITLLRRFVLVDEGEGYRRGALRFFGSPALTLEEDLLPKRSDSEEARAAARTPEGQKFLVWSRFPYFIAEKRGGDTFVHIYDARYPGPENSWASVTVRVSGGMP